MNAALRDGTTAMERVSDWEMTNQNAGCAAKTPRKVAMICRVLLLLQIAPVGSCGLGEGL